MTLITYRTLQQQQQQQQDPPEFPSVDLLLRVKPSSVMAIGAVGALCNEPTSAVAQPVCQTVLPKLSNGPTSWPESCKATACRAIVTGFQFDRTASQAAAPPSAKNVTNSKGGHCAFQCKRVVTHSPVICFAGSLVLYICNCSEHNWAGPPRGRGHH